MYSTVILDIITKFEDLESKSKCQKSNCYSKQKGASSAHIMAGLKVSKEAVLETHNANPKHNKEDPKWPHHQMINILLVP